MAISWTSKLMYLIQGLSERLKSDKIQEYLLVGILIDEW